MSKRPRRFAPLKDGDVEDSGAPKLAGIVFDVDGTLCEPQNYMFAEMREALGITKPTDILDHIYALPAAKQEDAMESIRKIERTAMTSQKPQPGLVTLMTYLTTKNMKMGICTRNFDMPVNHLLEKFLPEHKFHPIITREFRPPKPSPAGILHIAKQWDLASAENLIMVGDSIDDMAAGRAAGSATVLLVNDVNAHLADHENTDFVIRQLDDLIEVLDRGFFSRSNFMENKIWKSTSKEDKKAVLDLL
ncbi:haloacid dehalogenase-like hydrolase [Microthyrium microscopicum]|uniref:Haloacid dehalogenase-like hydrolase n=1 Tax=Microthyrium microscopicum TaxID=703497 RepID=A0A6A6UR35_9PEZI|nr:haloacid dehalogenase-like hydrolase [Microthyrium microscopicum]